MTIHYPWVLQKGALLLIAKFLMKTKTKYNGELVQLALCTRLAVPLLLALTILLSGQPAYAHVGSPLYTPGVYPLLPRGQPTDLDGNPVTTLPKLVVLSITRDSKGITFRFLWTHTPGSGASPDHFLFLA